MLHDMDDFCFIPSTVLKMMVKNVENRPELEEVISELEEISEIRMEL